jgi:hypothetical protein
MTVTLREPLGQNSVVLVRRRPHSPFPRAAVEQKLVLANLLGGQWIREWLAAIAALPTGCRSGAVDEQPLTAGTTWAWREAHEDGGHRATLRGSEDGRPSKVTSLWRR